MITSVDVLDYVDGLLREMREVHPEWVCLNLEGAFFTSGEAPYIKWRAFAAGTPHSPPFERAEEALEWLNKWNGEEVSQLKHRANELQTEAERLLKKAQELETLSQ